MESQSTQMKNQPQNSLLPMPVKGSSIDPAIRRRHIAVLRSNQLQNDQASYASVPTQNGLAGATSLSQAGDQSNHRSFAENVGLYSGVAASSSVVNLRGNNQMLRPQYSHAYGFKEQSQANDAETLPSIANLHNK
jgi:hypothetical protein